jgi:hypothetical protein
MALTKKQVADVCLIHQSHKQCCYLDEAMAQNGDIVYVCRKLSPEKNTIDEELDDFVAECKKNNNNPKAQDVPMGDNCKGYVPLANIKQGYDV